MNTHSIGVAGEDLAVKYLSKRKYKYWNVISAASSAKST